MPFPRSRTLLVSAAAVAGRSARPAAAELRCSVLLASAQTSPAAASAKAPVAAAFGRRALFHSSARLFDDSAAAEGHVGSVADSAIETKERFDSVTAINPGTARAIREVFKYEIMSPVQTAILGRMPTDRDMFVKAKTGTGKTLAFLIPAIESLLRRRAEKNTTGGSIVIVSPTRELAMQIADEADKVSEYHGFVIHELVGGNSKGQQMQGLRRYSKDIIVGTPGRLRDLIDSSPEFASAVKENEVLILDEADQLLEMGFRDKIQDILSFFPASRQTLLFSATVSKAVRNVANIALRDDHDFIDLVPENEQNVHMHIPQMYAIHNTPKLPELIHRIMQANVDKKVILFCPTTKATQVYAEFLRFAGCKKVFELHSGKAQETRTNTSERFRKSSSGVLVTTDVSARGVDYPDVHLVVQVGMPSNRDQYIHRIGRTGRAGKGGSALLVLNPWEKGFLEALSDLPVKMCSDWSAEAMARKYGEGLLDDPEGDHKRKEAAGRMNVELVQDCIRSFCGYYTTNQDFLNTRLQDLPDHLASFAHAFNVPPPDRMSLSRFLGNRGNQRGSSYSRGGTRRGSSFGGNYSRNGMRGGSSYGGDFASGRISQGVSRRARAYDE